MLAIHISNRSFDVEPGLARLASELDVVGVVRNHQPTAELGAGEDVHELDPEGRGPRWTDDVSDILSALHVG